MGELHIAKPEAPEAQHANHAATAQDEAVYHLQNAADQARGLIQPAVATEADKATAANVEEARYRPLGGAAIVGGVIAGGIIGGEMAGGAMQQGCRRVVERDQFGRPHMELVCPPVNQLYQSNPNRIYQGY